MPEMLPAHTFNLSQLYLDFKTTSWRPKKRRYKNITLLYFLKNNTAQRLSDATASKESLWSSGWRWQISIAQILKGKQNIISVYLRLSQQPQSLLLPTSRHKQNSRLVWMDAWIHYGSYPNKLIHWNKSDVLKLHDKVCSEAKMRYCVTVTQPPVNCDTACTDAKAFLKKKKHQLTLRLIIMSIDWLPVGDWWIHQGHIDHQLPLTLQMQETTGGQNKRLV